MAITAGEIRVGSSGSVHIAATGSTLPTEPDVALDAAFEDLGAVTEDGVAISPSASVNKIRAWQSRRPVRVIKTEEDLTLSFALQQWNETTVPLAFGGGTISTTTGTNYKFTPPADGSIDERAFVLEWTDSGYTYRLVAARVMVTETDEIALQQSDAAALGITLEVLGDDTDAGWYMLTDDPNFA